MGRKLTKTFCGLFTLTAATYACNSLIFKNAVRKELLDYSNGRKYDTSNGKMFYKVYGEGSPLLLIHDIDFCSSGYEWNNIIKYLSKKYKVYVVDLLGCGRSSKINTSYTAYLYIQSLFSFIENVIGERVSIIASGNSVPIVLKMYSMNSEMITKIVAISPEYIRKPIFLKNNKKDRIFNCIMEAPIIGTAIYNYFSSKQKIENLFTNKYYYDECRINNKVINAYYESAHLSGFYSKYLYFSLKKNYLYCNCLDVLHKIDDNVLKVICGKEDKSSDNVISQYSKHSVRFNYSYISHAKKMPHMECPNYVSKVIVDFLKK